MVSIVVHSQRPQWNSKRIAHAWNRPYDWMTAVTSAAPGSTLCIRQLRTWGAIERIRRVRAGIGRRARA